MVRCVAFVRNVLNAPQKIVAQNSCMTPQFAPSLPLHIEHPITSAPVRTFLQMPKI